MLDQGSAVRGAVCEDIEDSAGAPWRSPPDTSELALQVQRTFCGSIVNTAHMSLPSH